MPRGTGPGRQLAPATDDFTIDRTLNSEHLTPAAPTTAERGEPSQELADLAPRKVQIGRLVGLFVVIQVVALLLVIAAEMVPDKWVADALVEGIDRGWVAPVSLPRTGLDNLVDRWTECIALTVGLGDPPDANSIRTAITNPHLGWCEAAIKRLEAYRDGTPLESIGDYYRYWHGYTAFTRPSLAAFGVAGTRMIGLGLVVIAVAGAAFVVSKSTWVAAGAALVAPAILTGDLADIAESVPHAVITAGAWAALIVAWQVLQRRPTLDTVAVLGVALGSFAAFIELMVLMSGTLAMFGLTVVMVLWLAGWRRRRLLWPALLAVITWSAGFTLTWITKWIVAGLVVGFPQVLEEVRSVVGFRLTGEWAGVSEEFGASARVNLDYWFDRPLGFFIILGGILALALIARGLHRRTIDLTYLLLVLGLGSIPLAWFEVASNHSQIHPWTVYKSVPMVAGGVLCALVIAATGNRPEAPAVTASEEVDQRDRAAHERNPE